MSSFRNIAAMRGDGKQRKALALSPIIYSKAASSTREVQQGKAWAFDGVDDYVGCGSTVFGGDFTACAWIKWTGGSNECVFSKWLANDGWILYIHTGMFRFHVEASYIPSSTTHPSLGVWQHVAITRDDTTGDMVLYVNGVADNTGNIATYTESSNDLEIGRYGDSSTTAFTGNQSDVRFYQSALSAEDIATIYNGGNVAGAFRQYNLNTTSLFDSSGNGIDGTAYNGAAVVVDNTLPPAADRLNDDGFSEIMRLDKVDDFVTINFDNHWDVDDIKISGSFIIDDVSVVNGIISSRISYNNNCALYFYWDSSVNSFKFQLGTASGGYNGAFECVLVDNVIADGDRVDYEFTFDGINMSLTVNGASTAVARTEDAFLPTQPIVFGSIPSYALLGGVHISLALGTSSTTKSRYIRADFTDELSLADGTVNGSPATEFVPRDESSPTNDINGNALQYSGSVFPTRPKLIDSYCGVFDGVDDYAAGGLTALGGTITFAAWINVATSASPSAIISKWDYPLGVTFDVYLGKLRAIVNTAQFSTTEDVPHNEWSHVAITRDNATGTVSLYINGTLSSSSNLGSWTESTNELEIGREDKLNGNCFDGSISNALVYQSALSAEDIATIYNGGEVAGAFANYPIAEGVGATAYDVSGNGVHGVIKNSSTGTEGAGFWAGRQNNFHRNHDEGFTLDSGVRIPALADGSGDAADGSGALTNPAIPNGFNGSETKVERLDIAEGDNPCPASNDQSATPISFDDSHADLLADSPTDSNFRRDVSSVKKDRIVVYPDTLTGGDKTAVESYTT